MADMKEAVKKYWPYALGAVAALYFLTRSSGTSPSSGSSDYAAYLAAQTQAASVNSQTQQANATLAAQTDIANKQLALQQDDLYATAQNNYLSAQSGIVQAIGQAAGNLASALYQPAMVAMTNASNENQTALAAASAVAVGGYNAQVGLVNAGSQSVQSVSQAVSSMSNINAPKTESPFTTFMNSMTKLGTSYINSPFQLQ